MKSAARLRTTLSIEIPGEGTASKKIADVLEEQGVPVAAYDWNVKSECRRFVLMPRVGSGFLGGAQVPALQEDLNAIHRALAACSVLHLEIVER